MSFVLFLWYANSPPSFDNRAWWRYGGEYASEKMCHDSAKVLTVPPANYRCVRSK